MAKFRRKTLPIKEAEQYVGEGLVRGMHASVEFEIPQPYIITIQGVITFPKIGDWIIDEGDGTHFYPCAPDVFERDYEEIDA